MPDGVSSGSKDFDTLVAESSGAQAYRADEQVEPVNTGLDLERLAETLECVPLHERLSLPKEHLLPKQIAEFEHDAAQRLKAFEQKLKSIVTAEIRPDPVHDSLKQVMAALSDKKDSTAVAGRNNDDDGDNVHDDDGDDDDDDEEVDPNNVVDWLDKVLST